MTTPNCPFAVRRKEMVLCFALLLLTVTRGVNADRCNLRKWGSDRQTLLDLKFDGTTAVTGVALFYIADSQRSPYTPSIKTGTFNPETACSAWKASSRAEGCGRSVRDRRAVEQDSLKVKFVIGGNAGTLR